MKHALLFGCASKNSKRIIDVLLKQEYQIISIGSSEYEHPQVNNIQVSWDNLNIEFIQKTLGDLKCRLDFVFFNQNSSSLSQTDFDLRHNDILGKWRTVKDWSKSHWLSCQMPFLVLHTIRNNITDESKIGWMLSDYIDFTRSGSQLHPDYSGFKYFNFMAMQSFANTNACKTFGIFPDFAGANSNELLEDAITQVITTDIETKKCFYFRKM